MSRPTQRKRRHAVQGLIARAPERVREQAVLALQDARGRRREGERAGYGGQRLARQDARYWLARALCLRSDAVAVLP